MTEPGAPSLAATLNRKRLLQYFFFAVFLLLLWQIGRILSPFFAALLGSMLLSVVVYPLHARVLKRLQGYPSLAAALSTSLVVLIIVIPLLLFSWVFVREASKLYPVAQQWARRTAELREGGMASSLPPSALALAGKARALLGSWHIDPQEIFLNNLDELGQQMTRLATRMIKNAVFVAFNLLILTFALFFFLRDGPHLIRRLIELIPMDDEHKQAILSRIETTLYAVIRGVLVVALVQGVLAGVGFALFGVPFAVLLGALTAVFAPIPFVGTAAVWVPVVAGLLLNGAHSQALYLLLWSVFVVGMIDNVLRPILISANAKIPILFLFFGMLGGLRVYGFIGLLLGPLLIASFLAFINIYRQEYRWLLTSLKK